MLNHILAGLMAFFTAPAAAIDANCTQTTNLSIYRCPQNSVDWYQSYTGIVDNLDSISRTATSSFTVAGAGGLSVTYGTSGATATYTGNVSVSSLSATGTGGPFAITSSTGIRINTGRLGFGSGGYVQWADGTTSTTAAGGGGSGTTHTSSCTRIADGTFTQSTFVLAFATVAFTGDGTSPIDVFLNLSVTDDAGSRTISSGFMVDGAFVAGSGMSSTVGKTANRVATSAVTGTMGLDFWHTIDGASGGTIPSSGSHNYAVTMRTDGGTITFPANPSGGVTVGQFCVRQN